MSSASISENHAPAIGECADDTASLDQIFPVRPCLNQRSQVGFAVHSYNFHSKCLQPVGSWHPTRMQAMRERDQLLETLDAEVAL